MEVLDVGKQIKKARQAKNLTQKQLAAELGVATGTIQQYELGKRQPRFEQLQAIAEKLDIYVLDLINPDIAETLKIITDIKITNEDEAIKERFNITGDYVVVETDDQSINSLLQVYSTLNTAGQSKVIEYAEDIAENSKYKRFKLTDSAESTEEYTDTGKQKKPSEGDTTPTNG